MAVLGGKWKLNVRICFLNQERYVFAWNRVFGIFWFEIRVGVLAVGDLRTHKCHLSSHLSSYAFVERKR